jgi:anaerobic selenocysteine-containing dehydrogenase
MNTDDAAARGISDNEEVQVVNDMGSFCVLVKLSQSVRPGQVISYNGWEPYQYRGWQDAANVEPGMVKWLHLAGGYGHLATGRSMAALPRRPRHNGDVRR